MNTAGMRAAIVGAGGIARVHARLIRELGGNLVGVCGRTLAAARAFDAEPYDNLQQLLREQKPEVVHVCSPNHLHAEHSMMAFAAGAHVVCEKPMATNADSCRRMIEAAEQAQRLGAIAYTYRGYPLIEVLRRQVADGRFGALRRIGGCYLSQDVWAPDTYVWMFTPGTTGGSYVLMDLGVHWLNLAEYVAGTRILELSAQFSTHQKRRVWRGGAGQGPRPPGVAAADGAVAVETALEDHADLLLRFDNGAAGGLTVSGVSPGHPNTILLSADGAERGFDWNQQNPNVWIERGETGNTVRQRNPSDLPVALAWMSMLPPGHAEGYVDAFRNIVCQAWSAMRGEDVAFPGFADGLRGVSLVEAAIRSAVERRAVIVPAQLP